MRKLFVVMAAVDVFLQCKEKW